MKHTILLLLTVLVLSLTYCAKKEVKPSNTTEAQVENMDQGLPKSRELGEGKNLNYTYLYTCEDLYKMEEAKLNDYFILANDIDCQGVNFKPIRDFSGHLMGENRTISNLYITDADLINSSEPYNLGLFQSVFAGKLDPLGNIVLPISIINVNFKNSAVGVNGNPEYVGFLIGDATGLSMTNVSIENVAVYTYKKGGGLNFRAMGGLFGRLRDSEVNQLKIRNLSVEAFYANTIKHLGGVTGELLSSSIMGLKYIVLLEIYINSKLAYTTNNVAPIPINKTTIGLVAGMIFDPSISSIDPQAQSTCEGGCGTPIVEHVREKNINNIEQLIKSK